MKEKDRPIVDQAFLSVALQGSVLRIQIRKV